MGRGKTPPSLKRGVKSKKRSRFKLKNPKSLKIHFFRHFDEVLASQNVSKCDLKKKIQHSVSKRIKTRYKKKDSTLRKKH